MATDGSVAPKERVNIVYRPATGDAQAEVELPLKLLVGVRSAKNPATKDNCPRFAEPLVRAWGLPFAWGEDVAALATDGPFVLLWPE